MGTEALRAAGCLLGGLPQRSDRQVLSPEGLKVEAVFLVVAAKCAPADIGRGHSGEVWKPNRIDLPVSLSEAPRVANGDEPVTA